MSRIPREHSSEELWRQSCGVLEAYVFTVWTFIHLIKHWRVLSTGRYSFCIYYTRHGSLSPLLSRLCRIVVWNRDRQSSCYRASECGTTNPLAVKEGVFFYCIPECISPQYDDRRLLRIVNVRTSNALPLITSLLMVRVNFNPLLLVLLVGQQPLKTDRLALRERVRILGCFAGMVLCLHGLH